MSPISNRAMEKLSALVAKRRHSKRVQAPLTPGQKAEHSRMHRRLCDAVRVGDLPSLKKLVGSGGLLAKLKYGKHLDLDVQNSTGTTPLICAVCFGRLEVVQYLISKTANVNVADFFGRTALHYAAVAAIYSGSAAIVNPLVQALIDGGADVNVVDKSGRTAYSLAVCVGNFSAAYTISQDASAVTSAARRHTMRSDQHATDLAIALQHFELDDEDCSSDEDSTLD